MRKEEKDSNMYASSVLENISDESLNRILLKQLMTTK